LVLIIIIAQNRFKANYRRNLKISNIFEFCLAKILQNPGFPTLANSFDNQALHPFSVDIKRPSDPIACPIQDIKKALTGNFHISNPYSGFVSH
jgi:hypothetical protein